MGISIDQVIPWGRTRREYELMFDLRAGDLRGGVLDCGGGPASFVAETSAAGVRAIAVDPIYACSGLGIQRRFESVVGPIMAQVRAAPEDWVWQYHRDPDGLCATRRSALERFLADYDQGLRQGRYVVGELPSLPFEPASFGLALCSHFLFLYSDLFSKDFHVRSVLELCRVAEEVRLFPLLTLGGQPSPHLPVVQSALHRAGWTSEVVPVGYELQPGGDKMLRIFRE